jgi:arsenate reductase
VLFLCTGNAARSQMAEGLGRRLLPADWEVWSAGTHPSGVHPLAVEAMDEIGIDIRGQHSKHVDDVPAPVDLVITLCASAAAECPTFPGARRVLHWNLEDPVGTAGEEARRAAFRATRSEIESRLHRLLEEGIVFS